MRNSTRKKLAPVLFSLKITAIIGAFPVPNALVMLCTMWFYPITLTAAAVIEGFLIWRFCRKENGDIHPFPRTLLAYIPLLLQSGALFFLR